jgi:hypothetical protein
MRIKQLMLVFGTLALGIATAANTYQFKLLEPAWVGSTELKPGEYKVQVEGDKAMIMNGKKAVDVEAKAEAGDQKFSATQISTDTAGGQAKLKEVRIGGTKTKIVFAQQQTAGGGQ